MAYDSWENIGYKVLDELDKINNAILNLNKDVNEMRFSVSSINTKMWLISIAASVGVAIIVKIAKLQG
jgi:hypothetical protein